MFIDRVHPDAMIIKYYSSRLEHILHSVLSIVEEHYKEISIFHKLGFPFDPDIESYLAFDKTGQLKIFTAEFEGEILGYVFYSLYPHPHSKKVRCAMMDLIYIKPKYRSIGVGKKLINYAEKELKASNINFVITCMTVDYDFTPLMNSLDYKPMDKLFYKEI